MAPEIAANHYTEAVDIWALGICILEMSITQEHVEEFVISRD